MPSNDVKCVSCFVDFYGVAQLEINDGDTVRRFTITDPHVLLNAAEKMHLVGQSLLRHAPRPDPSFQPTKV